MQSNLQETTVKKPVLTKFITSRYLRLGIQLLVAFMMLLAAWQFYDFLHYIRVDSSGAMPTRPPVVEGFLPIAAIVAFKAWLASWIIDPIHPAGLIIFLAMLSTAWLFRRAVCSWICPIGTLSEYLGKIGTKIMGRSLKVPKWLDYILLVVKYGLLVFIFKTFFLMSSEAAIGFMNIPYYAISDIKMFDMFTNLGTKGISIILVLVVLSIFIKSFWCRYLCPYGALLGVLGFFSPVFLTKNSETCINCGACNKACPNRVDVEGTKKVVTSTECTGCTSCVEVCPKKGTLQYKLFGVLPVKPLAFSAAFLMVFFGLILWAKATGHWESSLSIEQFQMIDKQFSSFGGFGQ